MNPDQKSGIEYEISETEVLEASSAVSDVPNTVTRDTNLFDEQANHVDTGVDVVVVTDVENVSDVDVVTGPNIDVDIDTHVDQ